MDKPKTISEIKHSCYGVNTIELKKEAIKWYKLLENNELAYDDDLICYHDSGYDEYTSEAFSGVKSWIFDFFELTKEDIK